MRKRGGGWGWYAGIGKKRRADETQNENRKYDIGMG